MNTQRYYVALRNTSRTGGVAWLPKLLCYLLLALTLSACSPQQEQRRWVGADYFPMPLHDWSKEGDTLVSRPANFGGRWRNFQSRLYLATAEVGTRGEFKLQLRVQARARPKSKNGRGGVWLGLKSATPSPQNVWIHPPKEPIFVGIGSQGRLHVGSHVVPKVLGQSAYVDIVIAGSVGEKSDHLSVMATTKRGQRVEHKQSLPAGSLKGSLSLLAQGKKSIWAFKNWKVSGDALIQTPERSVGPILWTQYTLQDNGYLKLQAQMVPLELTDVQSAALEFKRGSKWQEVATANLEPLSSTFLFRVEDLSAAEAIPYRVVYAGPSGETFWEGSIRANPREQNSFVMGVFNCNHGELFANDTMVRNVTLQDPDMLYFAGDQIYEGMDNIGVVREPPEGARLSYLSKYYQFGLAWRHLLKDRPSVIIPDDHDVFMPNIWGDNGLGYSMEPAWVNMIQRTQTGSLPDPVDPKPVERGIDVYFTALDYAGMSFAVIEDRKFKSSHKIASGIASQEPDPLTNLDVPNATLLGDRQLSFLADWSERTNDLPARWFLSQSMLAKGNTHIGKTLRRFYRDVDTNGWPQSARNKALRTLPRDTIMLHGDQHLGMLARMGADAWEDGPLAFMVTGSAVGFPRAWWPDVAPADGPINGPHTGRFIDDMGNYLTVLGVTNPEPIPPGGDAVNRPDYAGTGTFQVQHAKGAGHGLVIVDKAEQEARFEAYRLDFDATQPKPSDQFPGFPITVQLR